MFPYRRECAAAVDASMTAVFDYADDPARFASHMNERSWRTGGSRMEYDIDEAHGRAVGSRIRLSGRVLGLHLFLDEAIVERAPPHRKIWETVSEPRLIVIGRYRMGFEVTAAPQGSRLRVFIDYALPPSGAPRFFARLLAACYADWCIHRMLNDAVRHFQSMAVPTRKEGCRVT